MAAEAPTRGAMIQIPETNGGIENQEACHDYDTSILGLFTLNVDNERSCHDCFIGSVNCHCLTGIRWFERDKSLLPFGASRCPSCDWPN